jgi:hypothetical protein
VAMTAKAGSVLRLVGNKAVDRLQALQPQQASVTPV